MAERTDSPDDVSEADVASREMVEAETTAIVTKAGETVERTDGVAELLRQADDRVSKYRLPLMQPPAGLNAEYVFPDNAAHLASVELGTLQLKLTGWYSWAIRCLSQEATELSAFESTYEIRLGHAMHEEGQRHDKRPVKESLMALAVLNDERLERMSRLLIRKRAVVSKLTDQVKIYEKQLMHLSREQSRRESEARVGQ